MHKKGSSKSHKTEKILKEKYAVCKTCVFKYKRKKPISEENQPRQSSFEKKQKLVELLGGKCEICGYDKSPAALSFHHKNRKNKVFSISVHSSLPIEDLIEEVKKCRLLCLNCHAVLHHDENRSSISS